MEKKLNERKKDEHVHVASIERKTKYETYKKGPFAGCYQQRSPLPSQPGRSRVGTLMHKCLVEKTRIKAKRAQGVHGPAGSSMCSKISIPRLRAVFTGTHTSCSLAKNTVNPSHLPMSPWLDAKASMRKSVGGHVSATSVFVRVRVHVRVGVCVCVQVSLGQSLSV